MINSPMSQHRSAFKVQIAFERFAVLGSLALKISILTINQYLARSVVKCHPVDGLNEFLITDSTISL